MVSTSTADRADNFTIIQLVALNVFVASSLVVANKHLLSNSSFPASSAALTFFHYVSTFVSLRVWHDYLSVENSAEKIGHTKAIGVSLVATFGVVCSNLTLRMSSVSFHQVSRLLALPGGLLFDYFLYKKQRTLVEIWCIAIIAYGVYQVCADDPTAQLTSVVFAVLSVFAMLTTAASIRRICGECKVSPVECTHALAPWGALSAGFWWLAAAITEQNIQGLPRSSLVVSPTFVLVLVLNCLLAVLLNISSTWCAARCSTLMYGVIGQIKTLASIALGTQLFNEEISPRSMLCLCIAFLAFLILIFLEHLAGLNKDTAALDEKHSPGKLENSGWPYLALSILACVLLLSDAYAAPADPFAAVMLVAGVNVSRNIDAVSEPR